MHDKVVITNEKLYIITQEGKNVTRSVQLLDNMYQKELSPVVEKIALPDGVKFVERRGPYMICVHQQKPMVRNILWKDKEEGEHYVRLAFPYVTTFATFSSENRYGLTHVEFTEVYFSNKPIVNKKSKLYFPAIPHVFNFKDEDEDIKRDEAWACTSGIEVDINDHWTVALDKLLCHFWNTPFNENEGIGSDWYSTYKGKDSQLVPVKKWEKATKNDPNFPLKIKWTPAYNVGKVMDYLFAKMSSYGSSSCDSRHNVLKRIVRFAKV